MEKQNSEENDVPVEDDDTVRSKRFKLVVEEDKEHEAEEDEEFDGDSQIVSNHHRVDRSLYDYFQNFKQLKFIYAGYNTEEILGPDVFAGENTASEEDIERILTSKEVLQAMRQYKAANPRESMKQIKKKCRAILLRMAASYRERIFRPMAFAVHKILQSMYQGVHVNEHQLQHLKRVAAKAEKIRAPLIFLPSHRSHMDYLVMSWMLFHCNISLPFIAAGDNLNMPVVGKLLNSCGAFFIRRSFGDDMLYRAIFDEYVTSLLSHGYNMEFFIEGGRSRTGKVLRPRPGLLGVIVDAVLEGRVTEAFIVPLSITYDKVIETESYVNELMGQSKQPESLRNLLRSAKTLGVNFGWIDVRIAPPFSLRKFLQIQIQTRHLSPRHNPLDRRLLTQLVAYSIMYHINQACVIMPTALVVTVLLTHYGRGLSREQLIEKVRWLRMQVISRGGKVATFGSKNTAAVVDAAVNVLGNLIGKPNQTLVPVLTPSKRFELSYYRNQIIHIFVSEAVVACAVYSHTRLDTAAVVQKGQLLEDVKWLSRLLKGEFIYKPATDISMNFDETLDKMVERGIMKISDETISVGPSKETFVFLCFLLWPFIATYWITSVGLYSLLPDRITNEKTFLDRVQNLGITCYHTGMLDFYESVSKETIKNALALFEEIGVLSKKTIDRKKLNILCLEEAYRNEAHLKEFIQSIGKFRRTPKHSIDHSSLSETLKQMTTNLASNL